MPGNKSWFTKREKKQKKKTLRNNNKYAQAQQIVTLQKRVTEIAQKESLNRDFFNYLNEERQTCPAITGTSGYGYNCIPIIDSVNMRPCFDQPATPATESGQWRYHGSTINGRISISTENTNPIRITVFLVELRKDTRDVSLRNWGNNLSNMFSPDVATSTPQSNQPNPLICYSSGMGSVFLNNKVFKVLAKKTKDIGEVGYGTSSPAVRNIGDTQMSFTWKIKKNVLLSRSEPPILNSLESSIGYINKNAQTFLLIVTNNNANDLGDPQLEMLTVHTFSSGQ